MGGAIPGHPKEKEIGFMVIRCKWVNSNPLMVEYHDKEWGVPVHDENALFEFLTLEGAQAGLSWQTILNKRENYRNVFSGFDCRKVAGFNSRTVEKLIKYEGIVRNRMKIESTINNAKMIVRINKDYGSFDRFMWRFTDDKAMHNKWRTYKDIPAQTKESIEMSKDLRKHGFKFVGPTICYAFMQAVGMVNDHEEKCFRYKQVKDGKEAPPAL